MSRITLLIICLFTLTVCTSSNTPTSYTKVITDPVISYRKGHYRNVVQYFKTTPKALNSLEKKYILASSYMELRDYQQAFEAFHNIDAQELLHSDYKDLFPFYIRKYIQLLIQLEDSNILTDLEKGKLLQNIKLVPNDSPIRPYLDNELFSVLWSTKDYKTILSLNNNLSIQGKGWLELAKFELGQAYNIKNIIKAQHSFSKNKEYSNIMKTLSPDNFNNPLELSNLVVMSFRLPDYREKGLEFAQRYENITKNKEFYPQMLSLKYQLEKNTQAAIATLTNFIHKNPKASLDFYVHTYEYLVKRKQYNIADDIATKAHTQYSKEFYRKAENGLEFHQNPNYVLNWYKNNYQKISEEHHLQVLRALIRHDLKLAEKAVDLGIKVNLEHPSYILKYALIKEHQGKKEEAYKYYLRLIFQQAFGYSGIVAKQKEKAMRNEFRSIFDETVNDILKKLPTYDLKNRLMLMKSFLVDQELAQYVDKDQLKKDQEAFNNIVYKDINNVKDIPILEKYPKSLQNFAPETQDYIENSVLEAMKGDKDWHNTARYFYKYRDLFINSDIEGYLTFRLYFYIRDKFGYTYLPNYPRDIVELVFPKPEFELIQDWAGGDEDLAYWMLASFMAESHFRKRVYSHVGAVGFAQVMPYTAKDIKRWLKKPYLSNYDFYDNMRMGVYYHKKMYEMMDENMLLSLAAYNAGPGSVNRWKKKYKHINDIYLFIEAIDYKETRNYVKIINYNHGMYRLLNDYNLY